MEMDEVDDYEKKMLNKLAYPVSRDISKDLRL